jgi:DNA polymerase I-like protein with 3'-5' exonuclease and polymerase domains
MRLVFDIETNGLLRQLDKIHCLVAYDLDSETLFSCCAQEGFLSIEYGLDLLKKADELIGHNIIGFDLPAIKIVDPEFLYNQDSLSKIHDTLIYSRLLYPDMFERDIKFKKVRPGLYGRHSLESWGQRLGFPKGSFGKTTDWSEWSLDMQKYCEQDVKVSVKLFKLLETKPISKTALQLENEFSKIIQEQTDHGIWFDKEKALKLYKELKASKEELKTTLQEQIPPKVVETTFVPKRDNKKLGYKKGIPVLKRSEAPFNPGSRQQIVSYLIDKYDWQASQYTEKGNAKLSADILDKLPWEEAKLFAKYFEIGKIIGYIAEGKQAWLLFCEDGKIHGAVNPNGARTGRCTHFNPNLAQVPASNSFKGKECRELFFVPKGHLVGADAAQLELRILAHYLHPYDRGHYTKQILEGDIHTTNQKAAGLPTRDVAKTFIYAFIYGAGDTKLGSIIEPEASEARQKYLGRKAREQFLREIPGLGKLVSKVKEAYKKRKFLKGLDGRKLCPRAEHSALNTLIQGAGAVVMKMAAIRANSQVPSGARQVLNIHDEMQYYVPDYLDPDLVGSILVDSIKYGGEYFNLKCPMAGEYKVGKNWSETH